VCNGGAQGEVTFGGSATTRGSRFVIPVGSCRGVASGIGDQCLERQPHIFGQCTVADGYRLGVRLPRLGDGSPLPIIVTGRAGVDRTVDVLSYGAQAEIPCVGRRGAIQQRQARLQEGVALVRADKVMIEDITGCREVAGDVVIGQTRFRE
jgi:hypothetical protein